MRLRRAELGDAPRLAELADQLGYPTSPAAARARLEVLLQATVDHAVYVAEADGGTVVAWLHVFASLRLESASFAEIGGLVVDEQRRGSGVATLLVEAAERWARARGCQELRVRSNVLREAAHRFYERVGFRTLKSQVVFAKTLEEAGETPHPRSR